MDLATRIELVGLYYTNGKAPIATLRAYKKAHNCHNEPFNPNAISRLMERFVATGSVNDKPRSGRPSLVEERAPIVQQAFKGQKTEDEFKIATTRSVQHATSIPQCSVQRILRQKLS